MTEKEKAINTLDLLLGHERAAYEGLLPYENVLNIQEIEALGMLLKEALQERPKGRWVELPCEINDAVYLISYGDIHMFEVEAFHLNEYNFYFSALYCGEESNLKNWEIRFPVEKIGNTVFLTKEEAEKALADMRESEQE